MVEPDWSKLNVHKHAKKAHRNLFSIILKRLEISVSSAIFSLKVKLFSCVWLFATPWTVAHQAPQSMEFSRQEYWSGLPFPSPGDLPNPGIEPGSPALQADTLLSEPPRKPKGAGPRIVWNDAYRKAYCSSYSFCKNVMAGDIYQACKGSNAKSHTVG